MNVLCVRVGDTAYGGVEMATSGCCLSHNGEMPMETPSRRRDACEIPSTTS
ncbi:MAG: hypothetical protein K5787_02875 [Lentisphaeria bacterium]|nr:hypothetical protein [Lentisphaeria bacterium]